MQVSIETTSGLERRLTVGVPAERVDTEVDSRLKKAAGNVRLPGFRPGKVPMKVMRQRFGAGVRQEVLGEVMSQSFQEAVVQENLRPAGQPSIEPKIVEAGKDLEYTATFEVFPEVEVVEIKDFDVEKPVAEVTDQDVDDIVTVFRTQQGTWGSVDRPAAEGDKVNINYVGTRDGEEFEGGSATDSDLELGSGRMIPGFEDGVLGMEAGEEKTLELTFPEDYHNEELKGAAVQFVVTLNRVEELTPAALDEDLFAKYGVEEGGEETFRSEVRQNMERELKNAIEGKVKQQVMDALSSAHDAVEVPRALVDREIEVLRNQMFQQFGGAAGGQDLDLKSLLPDDMFAENAEKRVKLGLVMAELVSKLDIKVDPEKVRSTIEEMASTYQDPEEVVNYYYSNQEQLASVESKVMEDQMVARLLENAAVKEKQCSYQEALGKEEAAS
ncbi:MAG: trigger factor [Pseudomonadota bacterium]